MSAPASALFARPRRFPLAVATIMLGVLALAVVAAEPLRQFADALATPAGFQLGEGLLPAGPDDTIAWALVVGLINTTRVAALAAAVAVPLGLVLALLRQAGHPALRLLAGALIEPLRSTPVVLQLIAWYGALLLALPGPREALSPLPGVFLSNRGLVLPWITLDGVDWPRLVGFNFKGGVMLGPELTALTVGLAVFHAAYIAEVFRGALAAVPAGQNAAARALGLTEFQRLRHVALPLAASAALPPLATQVLALVKNASLAVAIGYPDLVSVANTWIGQSGQAFVPMMVVVGFYLALNAAIGAAIEGRNRALLARGRANLVPEPPRAGPASRRAWWGSGGAAAVSFAVALLGAAAIWRLVRWAVIDAAWSGGPQACVAAAGACWALVIEKAPLLAFGTYPANAVWRPTLASLILVGVLITLAAGAAPSLRARVAAILAAGSLWVWLMGGGGGLAPVPTTSWGGLAVTLGLAAGSFLGAIPLAVALAVMRLHGPRPVAGATVALVELLRSVPLVALLVAVSHLLPAALPWQQQVDPLWRALCGLVLLTAANLSEVLRGALQALPAGQRSAGLALGLTRAETFLLIELPLAVRIGLPAAVNVAIGAFKDTSLVFVVGLFDLLGAARAAALEPVWRAHAGSVYVAAAFAYGVFCAGLAIYGRRLEAPTARPSASTSRSTSRGPV